MKMTELKKEETEVSNRIITLEEELIKSNVEERVLILDRRYKYIGALNIVQHHIHNITYNHAKKSKARSKEIAIS